MRRSVAELTELDKLTGHLSGIRGDGGVPKEHPMIRCCHDAGAAEGNTWKPRELGIASVRLGPAPRKMGANPCEAESAQAGVAEARRPP